MEMDPRGAHWNREATMRYALVIMVGLLAMRGQVAAVEYHVSTAGNDGGPGTAAMPFASLGRAQLAVRARIAAGPPRGENSLTPGR